MLPSRRVDLPHSFRSMTMGRAVQAARHRHPDKIAVVHGPHSRTYAQFADRAAAIARACVDVLGLRPGDRAAIAANNCIEYLEIIIGVPDAGVPVATINSRLTAEEIVAICNDAAARVLFADAGTAARLRGAAFRSIERIIEIGAAFESWLTSADPATPLPQVDEWDIWTIPYTSGTTGEPKGVMLSHRARLLNFFAKAQEYGCFSPDDRFLSITPMNHGPGTSFPLNALVFGGSVEIMDRFDPAAVLRKLKSGAFDGIFTVPTHFHEFFALDPALLEQCRRPPLKAIISNAAPLPQELKPRIVEFFGEGLLHELYSSTETSLVCSLRPADQLVKPRSVGLPFAAHPVRIVGDDGVDCAPGEVGELFANSPYLFSGYWNRPAETAAAFRGEWVSVGRHGATRRGRLPLHRRSQEGHGDLRRGQHLSARGGAGPGETPADRRGRGRRRARRQVGRATARVRRGARRRVSWRRRAPHLLRRPAGRVQGAARDRGARFAAAQRQRQGAEAGTAPARSRRLRCGRALRRSGPSAKVALNRAEQRPRMTSLSISRSVSRAFEVLEHFRHRGAPRTMLELETELRYPYSSMRAILKTLCDLGYLEFEAEHKRYFPTQRLMGLGDWVQSALLKTDSLIWLLEATHKRVGETVALATPNFIFCNVFEVRLGTGPGALEIPPGVGLTLTNSSSGRVLLSQMSDSKVEGAIRHTQYWIGATRTPIVANRQDVLRAIELIRSQGHYLNYDSFKPGQGTIAYPVPSPLQGSPIALFVSGDSARIRRAEARIRSTIETNLASYVREPG